MEFAGSKFFSDDPFMFTCRRLFKIVFDNIVLKLSFTKFIRLNPHDLISCTIYVADFSKA